MVQIRRNKRDNTVAFLATDYSRSWRGTFCPWRWASLWRVRV